MNIYDAFQTISARLVGTVRNTSNFLNTLALPIAGELDDEDVQSIISDFTPSDFVYGGSESFGITDISNGFIHILHKFKLNGADLSETVSFPIQLSDKEIFNKLRESIFTQADAGITNFHELLTTVKSSMATNSVVEQITQIFTRAGASDNDVNSTDVLALINDKINQFGATPGLKTFKNFFTSLGGKVTNFEWANCITSMFQKATNALGDSTITGFNDVMPTVDEFNWTVLGQIGATIAQTVGYAIIGVSKVLGVIVSLIGNVINTFANLVGGNDQYSKTKAINCYLNIPLIAKNESTSATNVFVTKKSSPFMDIYRRAVNGHIYTNAYLKPVLTSGMDCPYLVQNPDDPYGGLDRGSHVLGLLSPTLDKKYIICNLVGPTYNPNLITGYDMLTHLQNDLPATLGWLNLAFASSMLMVAYSALVGRQFRWKDIPGINYGGNKIMTVPVVAWKPLPTHNEHMSMYSIFSALVNIVIVGSGYLSSMDDTQAWIYTKALADCIKSFRNLCDPTPSTSFNEFLVTTAPVERVQSLGDAYYFSTTGETAPQFAILPDSSDSVKIKNAGDQFANQGGSYFDSVDILPLKSPNWASNLHTVYALVYNGFSGDLTNVSQADAVNIVTINDVDLPQKATYVFPQATVIGKWLTTIAVTAAVAVAVVAATVGWAAIKNKYGKWQVRKIKQLDALKDSVDPNDKAQVAEYYKKVKRYNFMNKFLPGGYTYNGVSGWAEIASSEGATNDPIDNVAQMIGPDPENGVSLDVIYHTLTGL